MSPAITSTSSTSLAPSTPAPHSNSASSPSSSAPSASKPAQRKTRVIKRRGRAARLEASDDEIERDAPSDDSASDSDLSDDLSDEDEDEESDNEVQAQAGAVKDDGRVKGKELGVNGHDGGRARADSSVSRSGAPDDDDDDGRPEPPRSAPAFFSAGADWSEMVAETDGMPVIEFGDLGEHASSDAANATVNKKDDEDAPAEDAGKGDAAESKGDQTQRPPRGGPPARGVPRGNGQSARQAYQQRLQADPSFVPVVGEFWGHDDRLMQKDLRSLSGWWRGKWQGRGRGRGGFVDRGGWRGRGRGGFMGGSSNGMDGEQDGQNGQFETQDVPPIERDWTHDGFEEMKAKEERIKAIRQEQSQRGRFAGRGTPARGAFAPRGKGIPESRSATVSPTAARRMPFSRANGDRPWFAVKPENIWTKQHESYLPTLRQAQTNVTTIRLRIPGKDSKPAKITAKKSEPHSDVPISSSQSETAGSTDAGSRTVVVNLPKHLSKLALDEKPAELTPLAQTESPTTVETVPEEAAVAQTEPEPAVAPQFPPAYNTVMATPSLTRDNSVSEHSDGHVAPESSVQPEIPLDARKPVQDVAQPSVSIPPVHTGYLPPIQPTPTYAASPYGYTPPLPPGIAINQQPYVYDVASGRPMYNYPTPPPMAVYHPRPVPYGHMHHHSHSHSMSGDFMHASSPPINGFVDPSTGVPLFAPPRQSTRVEIRAPADGSEGRSGKSERRPSNLRASTISASANGEASHSSPQAQATQMQPHALGPAPSGLARFASAPEYFPSDPSMRTYHTHHPSISTSASEGGMAMTPSQENGSEVGAGVAPVHGQPPMDPNMMGYVPYQQQYYYPEQYYQAYVEMPQGSTQYDPYAMDPHHQQTVYY